ncbi:LacI family DNA-binding transcriptional regulator [Pseudoduganella albidiflava]|uniref:LacI family transcriptional regulator n=1 Tax=Pseudoduganella albidiflava TaxID=321983 RepID=A0A411X266_9BURK|nr:LacI family DNA-binding transcriptional regulator [Pseudoduganella albidiflava]QBI03086.1 LacI family transcriptional regulator [Pseudoduganella albidiflava]GGY58917.1 LacI family transcriptional regulator [Pseudoduganella albidiflava]
MAVTIKDVAQAANVSVASVSRVLNGHATVTEETRAHILAIMKQLRYVPHVGARSLSTSLTNTVGVLLPDLYGEYFSEMIRGIDGAARRRGLHLLVASLHGGADEAATALRTMRGRVDGLLVMSPHADAAFLSDNLPEHLPIVLLNSCAGGGAYASVSIDNYSAAYAMVEHLAASGHRSIGFITGPAGNFEAQERLRGYRAALAALLPGAREELHEGDFSEEAGARVGAALARRIGARTGARKEANQRRPHALFAANDMMAIGAQLALQAAGVDVPGDIALAGFDDIPVARYVTPALTTVRVPIAGMGEQALDRLAGLVAGEAGGGAQTLEAQLVVRASSGHTGRAASHRIPIKGD